MNSSAVSLPVRLLATPRVDVVCFRPAGGHAIAFESRLRRAVARLGNLACLVIAPGPGSQPTPPGIYLSPTWPTVVMFVDGNLMAQAIGDLPLFELESLLTTALRNGRQA